MSALTHRFEESLQRGQASERFLDSFFSQWFYIREATREEQRQGIDRHFEDKVNGKINTVEYKADERATQTGNAFIETVSVDTAGKTGWANKSKAVILAYYLPLDDLIYWLSMKTVRACLPTWAAKYPVRKAQNQGYATHGICVPLHEFERVSKQVIQVKEFPLSR